MTKPKPMPGIICRYSDYTCVHNLRFQPEYMPQVPITRVPTWINVFNDDYFYTWQQSTTGSSILQRKMVKYYLQLSTERKRRNVR